MDIEDTVENLAGRVIDLLAQAKEDQARIAELEYQVNRLNGHWSMEAELRSHRDVALSNRVDNLTRQVETSRMLIDELTKKLHDLPNKLANEIRMNTGRLES